MTLLEDLGIDPEDLQWRDLSLCRAMSTEWKSDEDWFFDSYEDDEFFAKNIDQLCLSCPVQAECLREGTANKEQGVWGGVYLTEGKPDKNKNRHKTDKIWHEIEQKTGLKR